MGEEVIVKAILIICGFNHKVRIIQCRTVLGPVFNKIKFSRLMAKRSGLN